MSQPKTFEDFLREEFFKEYLGHKDGFEERFNLWLETLQADDFIKYGDEYGRNQNNTQ